MPKAKEETASMIRFLWKHGSRDVKQMARLAGVDVRVVHGILSPYKQEPTKKVRKQRY